MRWILIKRPRPQGRSREIQGCSLLTSSTGTPQAIKRRGEVGTPLPLGACLLAYLRVWAPTEGSIGKLAAICQEKHGLPSPKAGSPDYGSQHLHPR